VYADRWADGNGASLAAVQGEVLGEALFLLVTADHVFGEGGLERLLAAAEPAVLIDPAPNRLAWAEGTQGLGKVLVCLAGDGRVSGPGWL
jgi:choline kinase